MIVFNLGCENGHRFEGWFASGEDYERQIGGRLLSCPICGNAGISRLPNASHVVTGARERRAERGELSASQGQQQYANMGGEMLARLIEQIVEQTEDVGPAFPEEARKIHYREAPERRIRGSATSEEVAALQEEGIEVVALPIPGHLLGKRH
jgi:hypothetical protein